MQEKYIFTFYKSARTFYYVVYKIVVSHGLKIQLLHARTPKQNNYKKGTIS